MLTNNTKAPDFSLTADDNSVHSLNQYVGKPLVLLFLRGKFCPTTRKFLLEWQDFNRRIHTLKANLVAISYDSVSVQQELKKQYDIRFPLLSDPDLAVSKEYGVYLDTNKAGERYGEPAVVILDKEGKVAYSLISSGPKGLPGPEYMANMLIYMLAHDGVY